MDLDVFVAAHQAEWARLEQLLGRGRRLTGDEADELVALYQRTSTHLSLIQSSTPDPMLTGRLTQLVARARATVTGARRGGWRDAARFFTMRLPGRRLRQPPLVDTHGADLPRRRRTHGLVDRHPPRGPERHRSSRGPEGDDEAGR